MRFLLASLLVLTTAAANAATYTFSSEDVSFSLATPQPITSTASFAFDALTSVEAFLPITSIDFAAWEGYDVLTVSMAGDGYALAIPYYFAEKSFASYGVHAPFWESGTLAVSPVMFASSSAVAQPVPEPGSALAVGMGVCALASRRRRTRSVTGSEG